MDPFNAAWSILKMADVFIDPVSTHRAGFYRGGPPGGVTLNERPYLGITNPDGSARYQNPNVTQFGVNEEAREGEDFRRGSSAPRTMEGLSDLSMFDSAGRFSGPAFVGVQLARTNDERYLPKPDWETDFDEAVSHFARTADHEHVHRMIDPEIYDWVKESLHNKDSPLRRRIIEGMSELELEKNPLSERDVSGHAHEYGAYQAEAMEHAFSDGGPGAIGSARDMLSRKLAIHPSAEKYFRFLRDLKRRENEKKWALEDAEKNQSFNLFR